MPYYETQSLKTSNVVGRQRLAPSSEWGTLIRPECSLHISALGSEGARGVTVTRTVRARAAIETGFDEEEGGCSRCGVDAGGVRMAQGSWMQSAAG